MLAIERLTLTDFRNYAHLVWSPARSITVLTGPNGSGKTNLLEALSLLVPGRGLRAARLVDLPRREAKPDQATLDAAPTAATMAATSPSWAVAARLSRDGLPFEIGTGSAPDGGARRVFRLDGQPARNRSEVAERLAAVWLTPQMDRLFGEGTSGRRRFLDRLAMALHPEHAGELAAHDEALAGRNRLLQAARPDPAWLDSIEHSLARHAVAVTAARASLVGQMNRLARTRDESQRSFRPVRLSLECRIASRLAEQPALAVEDWLRDGWRASRTADAANGATAFGAHRADLALSDWRSGLPAAAGSTGQQKAMLIGLVLAHAVLVGTQRGEAPLLLLDEPLVHLDQAARAQLFAELLSLSGPVLLSGTDEAPFAPLAGRAETLRVSEGGLQPDDGFREDKAGSAEGGAV